MSKIRPKECLDVEFKRIWKDEYLKWICDFANAQGAIMYFCVDDDREVACPCQRSRISAEAFR